MTEQTKKCAKCKCERKLSFFDKKRNKFSLYASCRKCLSKRKFKKPRKKLKSESYSGEEIISMLSFHLNIPVDHLTGDKWDVVSSVKRHLTMYCLFTYTILTYKEIATLLNRKDHTTVMYGVKKVIGFRNSYKEFNRILRSIQGALRSRNKKYFYKEAIRKNNATFSFLRSQSSST